MSAVVGSVHRAAGGLVPEKPGLQTVRRGLGRGSSSAFVLMDQPAKDVTATDRPNMVQRQWRLGHGEVEAPVGTGPL